MMALDEPFDFHFIEEGQILPLRPEVWQPIEKVEKDIQTDDALDAMSEATNEITGQAEEELAMVREELDAERLRAKALAKEISWLQTQKTMQEKASKDLRTVMRRFGAAYVITTITLGMLLLSALALPAGRPDACQPERWWSVEEGLFFWEACEQASVKHKERADFLAEALDRSRAECLRSSTTRAAVEEKLKDELTNASSMCTKAHDKLEIASMVITEQQEVIGALRRKVVASREKLRSRDFPGTFYRQPEVLQRLPGLEEGLRPLPIRKHPLTGKVALQEHGSGCPRSLKVKATTSTAVVVWHPEEEDNATQEDLKTAMSSTVPPTPVGLLAPPDNPLDARTGSHANILVARFFSRQVLPSVLNNRIITMQPMIVPQGDCDTRCRAQWWSKDGDSTCKCE
mmetsp:Transcript_49707/g.118460  ORF Transcript_49707/g.118460 Transcript_49707/m.118460 type:complete len:402 (+) Transcript_49707:135-1340(+)